MPTKKKASTTTTKKPAAKKPAAKKPAAKKAAAKKPAKKAAAKKVVKKAAKKAAKKTTAKKVAKKATKKVVKKAAKKTAAKKTAKKTTAKKVAKKAAKKVMKKAAKKAAAKKPAKKAAAKKPAKKAAAKKTATKKASAKLDIASLASAYADPAAIPLPAKKSSSSSSAKAEGHGAVALPAKKKALDVSGYGEAKPSSKRAAVTVVPTGDDDIDDALDDAMEDAFDAVFEKPKKLAKPTVPFVPGDPSLDLAHTCAALALEKKADDVVILQVAELTSYADYFVIAAAASERQAQAIARNISDELRRRGKHPLSTDGLEQGNWVIVDYGAVVVHVFMESARAYYDLDGFWVDAPRVDVDEARGAGNLEHLGS